MQRRNLQKDIDNVERVNRRAARFVSGDHRHQSSVSVMLEKLQWPTLEHRRENQRLTTMFTIVHGLVAVPSSSLGHVKSWSAPVDRSTFWVRSTT